MFVFMFMFVLTNYFLVSKAMYKNASIIQIFIEKLLQIRPQSQI